MKYRIRALGLAVLAVVAIAALGGSNAMATSGGHFVSESSPTLVKLTSNKVEHNFTWWNGNGTVTCGKLLMKARLSVRHLKASVSYRSGKKGASQEMANRNGIHTQ
jgi:hypothetical protein